MSILPASLLMASIPIILDIIPLLFLGIGIIMLLNQLRFARRAVAATGEVIDLRYNMGTEGGLYHPVVRFQCMDAQHWEEEIVFESSYGSRPPSHRVGDRVPVLYDPARPERAQINTLGARWLLPCIFIFIGIGTVLFLWGPMILSFRSFK